MHCPFKFALGFFHYNMPYPTHQILVLKLSSAALQIASG